MIPWFQTPMLKLTLAFLGGILLKAAGVPYLDILGIPVLLLYLGVLFFGKLSKGNERLTLLLALSLFATIGSWHYQLNTRPDKSPSLTAWACKTVEIGGIIASPVKSNSFGTRFHVDVFAIQAPNGPQVIQERVLCKLEHPLRETLTQEDTLFVRGYLTNFQSPFPSYRAYMTQQGISFTLYGDTAHVGGRSYSLVASARKIQRTLAARISLLIQDAKCQEIAMAMFLGDKSAMAQSTREPFVHSGASHILAISGMHVGIIFLLLNVLLSFFHLIPNGKQIKSGVILLLLLAYMLLTGMSPAVVRATLMFGLILVFQLFRVKFHIINVIAIAALIQLWLDPGILFNPGFQLSYSAVMGILLLYPQFEAWFSTQWIALKYLYSWIGISLCASLFTAPLVAFHFGSFPVYFLLTNILASTLSAIIVWTGFLLVLCIYVPFLSQGLAWACEHLLLVLFHIVAWVAQLPYGQIQSMDIRTEGWGLLFIELVAVLFLLLIPKLITQFFSPKISRVDPQF